MAALEKRVARVGEGIDRALDHRGERAIKNSQLPGMDSGNPPIKAPPKSPSSFFSAIGLRSVLERRPKRAKPDVQGPQR